MGPPAEDGENDEGKGKGRAKEKAREWVMRTWEPLPKTAMAKTRWNLQPRMVKMMKVKAKEAREKEARERRMRMTWDYPLRMARRMKKKMTWAPQLRTQR